MQASDLGLIILPIILVLFAVFGLNPFHRKNIDKPKPIDHQTITSNDLSGNVESIHPWGRTEVVPMKSIKLEYFQYCDEWVMYGEVEQPIGRKDYFMPVMKGHLDLNVKDLTQTWIEYGGYATGPEKDAETYEDFRMAHIKVNSGKVVNIKYSHYRLDQNKTWSIIAVWEARFSENF
jgi:hypothetical protein